MASIPPPGVEPPGQPPPLPPTAPPPPLPPRGPEGVRGWSPWFGLAAFAVGIGATLIGSVFVVGVAAAFGASFEDPPSGVLISLTVLQNVALFGAALGLAWIGGRPIASDFGLRPSGAFARSFWLGVGVCIGFYVIAYLWTLVLGLDSEQELPKELGADGPLVSQIAVAMLITIVAPLGEELFFRGFFYGSVRNWKGVWPAAIATGIVFGGIHVGSAPVGFLVPLGVFGVMLCLLYEATGSLYPCIAVHAVNNAIALSIEQEWTAGVALVLLVAAPLAAVGVAHLLARALGDKRPARWTPQPAALG